MTNIKMKSGSQIFAMMKRLTKEHKKCKKDKTFAHPDTMCVSGMLTILTWVTSNAVDSNVREYLRDLHKKVDIETFEPINVKKASEAMRKVMDKIKDNE